MQGMDSGDGAEMTRVEGDSARDAGTHPTVFAPGDDRVTAQELRSFSRPQALTRDRASEGLSDALIMMVDDEMLNIEMTQAFLVEAGYRRFVHTDQPQNAIGMMRKQQPAVLLLDLSMPGVSGLDILELMRSHPVLRHVPVIVLTGSTDPQVKLQALSLGAMDFLSKPVDPSELGLRIRNTLAASAYREYLSSHDPLTALPNKQRYRAAAAEVIAATVAAGATGALLHVGVDALGRINDALGRVVGDQLLQRVAKRLASCVQTESGGELSSAEHDPTLYRFDGDEFAIVVPFMEAGSAAAFISKLLEDAAVSFRRPSAPEVFVTCSIGVSVFPVDGTEPDLLIRNAGLALRHAKQGGTHRYEFFSPRFNEQAQSRLDFSAELRHAIGRDEIDLLYDPFVELEGDRVIGAQGVLRWRHASGRVVLGDALQELAARSEMDVALTEWAFEQMGRHVKNWRAAGLTPVPVSMTASLASMLPSEIATLVTSALGSGLEPRDITLVLDNVRGVESLPARELAAIAGLRTRGVRVAVAHLGSGTSLSHLRALACDEVRIDPSFLEGLDSDPALQAMLLGVGDLARRLRLKCVACGIDSAAQLAVLKAQGWDRGQGRLFGSPVSGLAFAGKWLTKGKPRQIPLEG
ncbi:EAL domain-containing protein [Ramlibacter sp. MMS24-I3-19]|uniref:EAL domain-containing protein n=1 Tax=Ramlibacter sp. MMS24-I3-19 TaxID=3416606 RepID=UPI003D07B755